MEIESGLTTEARFLRATVDRLKPAERDAIVAYYVGGLRLPEVERRTGLSARKFRSLRRSLRARFARFLADQAHERAARREEAWYRLVAGVTSWPQAARLRSSKKYGRPSASANPRERQPGFLEPHQTRNLVSTATQTFDDTFTVNDVIACITGDRHIDRPERLRIRALIAQVMISALRARRIDQRGGALRQEADDLEEGRA